MDLQELNQRLALYEKYGFDECSASGAGHSPETYPANNGLYHCEYCGAELLPNDQKLLCEGILDSNTTGKESPVIIVWDRVGNFFQIWPSTYNGNGIAHGKKIAEQIGGTYICINPTDIEKRIHQAMRFEVSQTSLGKPPGFTELFKRFFKWDTENV